MATSRERLNQTLNHTEPDRLVMDMGSTAVTGINANALHRGNDTICIHHLCPVSDRKSVV